MPDLADVVVVGGGVTGAALTLALARRNLRVVLLEAHRTASGATGSGFAWINATAKTEDETYFKLNAQGAAYYDRLAAEWGAERLGLHAGGALFWAREDDTPGLERLRARARLLQQWNYPAALLNLDELWVLEPNINRATSGTPVNLKNSQDSLQRTFQSASVPPKEQTAGTVLFAPADKWVDTARLCRFLIEQAQAGQAEIRLNCPATGFTRTVGNAISTVETPMGRIAAPLLVLAAGIDTPSLAARLTGSGEGAKYVPLRREPGLLVETPPLSPEQICSRILYPPDEGGLHLRPTPSGGLLIGADDTDAWLHRPDIQAKSVSGTSPDTLWQGLVDRATPWLPDLNAADLYARCAPRVCVRPVPADGFPIIGALPDVPNAYVAVTHSGVTLAPLLADLLAGEIFTRALSPLLAPYRPERFTA